MPRSLKLYIAGVVTLSALALVVATLWFPGPASADCPHHRHRGVDPVVPSQLEIFAGIAFWTLLTLVASAVPVRLPRGSYQAVAMAPIVAAMSLGGPAVAGWVAAIGTTEMRELRGRIPWYGTLGKSRGIDPAGYRRRCRSGSILQMVSAQEKRFLVANFVATLLGAMVFFALNVALAVSSRRPPNRSTIRFGPRRETLARRCLTVWHSRP